MRPRVYLFVLLCTAASQCPAVAQDAGAGGRLAFYSNRSGNDDIYVMNADGSGLTNLTNSPDARDLSPTWSPDGSRIAFRSYRDRVWDIYVMNADGSGVVNVTNNPRVDTDPVWSPDGRRIAFRSNRDGNLEIYVVNADGSGLLNLSDNPASDRRHAWSPDGSAVAFVSSRDGREQVYVVGADGSGLRRITHNPYTIDGQEQVVALSDPVWSPDGGSLALVVSDLNSVYSNLGRVDVESGDLQMLTSGTDQHGRPLWSPEGASLVCYSKRNDNWDIYLLEGLMDPGMPPVVVRLTEDPADDWFPVWSPDGSRVAFTSERDGNWEIYVVGADGTGLTNLTNSPGSDLGLSWGPGQ